MYAGHFAAALALKAQQPKAPTWGLLVGVGLLDWLFGAFVLLGIERVTPNPGHAPGFLLDDIRWSHSLLMSLVWSLLFALLFVRRGRPVALALGAAVFSHFLLDFPMHPGDLRLYPGATTPLGLGLWAQLPIGWWFVELAFIVGAGLFYLARAHPGTAFGGRARWVVAVVLLLHASNAPWLSPVG